MAAHRRAASSLAVAAAALALVLLLPGALPQSRSTTPPSTGGFSVASAAPSSAAATVPSGAADLPTAGATAGWSGRIARTLLVNYNGSVAGNFPSMVRDLEVGAPAFLPSTGSLWWPELPVAGNGSSAPPTGPAIVYNLTGRDVQGVEEAVANASALLYDASSGRLYAAEPRTDSVGVYDPSTGAPLAPPIPVGSDPRALGYDPTTEQLFVANAGSDNVSVINTSTDRIAYAGIPVGVRPVALAVDATDGWVYVANAGSPNLTVLRTAAPNAVPGWVQLYFGPAVNLAYSVSTGILAAVEPASHDLTVIEAATWAVIPQSIEVGTGFAAVTTDGSGALFVVANTSGSELLTVKAAAPFTVSSTSIAVGPGPSVLATDPVTGDVVTWSYGDRTFTEVDPITGAVVGRTLPLDSSPAALAYDPSTGRLYVADAALPGVEVLDPFTGAALAAPLLLSAAPTSIALDPAHGILYVATDGEVAAYHTSDWSPLQSNQDLPGANGPLLFDPLSSLLWVGRPGPGEFVGLSSTTLATVVHTPSLGVDATAVSSLTLDPAIDALFAVDFSSDTVRAFNGSNGSWVGSGVSAGGNVTSLAYDAADRLVYAAGDGLSAIDPTDLTAVLRSVALAPHASVASLAYDPTRELLLARTLDAGGTASISVVDGASASAANSSLLVLPAGLGSGALAALPTPAGSLPGAGVTVTSNAGSGTISVAAAPVSIVSFAFSPGPVDANGTTTGTLLASGGAGPVTVDYAGLPPGCPSASVLVLACVPTETGTFSVTASLTDALGQSAEASALLEVGDPLIARATVGVAPSGEVDVGTPVSCLATLSGGLTPYTARWSFGDGQSAVGLEVNHTFTTTGPTTVTLAASDAGGGSVSVSRALTVVPLPSVALTTDAPGLVTDVNLSVSFRANVTGGTAPGSGSWTFGDGTPPLEGPAAEHAFASPGLYLVTFRWVDASGVSTGGSLELLVHPALLGTFRAEPSHGLGGTGEPFSFLGNISGGTPPYAVSWSFGDGSYGSGPAPHHLYARPGSYTANVTVVDAAGAVLASSVTVRVGSSTTASWLPGGSVAGLAVGLMVGGSAVAAALFAVERSLHRRRFHPPRPYVPPPGTGPG